MDILLVDDSRTARIITKRCLETIFNEKMIFHEAGNGLEALAILSIEHIDIVLTDLNMPKLDGKGLIQKMQIHTEVKDIPIVIISSIKQDILEGKYKDMNITAFISKPISPSKMLVLKDIIPIDRGVKNEGK